MNQREFDPLRFDVPAFAKAAGHLSGNSPLSRFGRVIEMMAADAPASPADAAGLDWSVDGELIRQRGGEPRPRLHLVAHTCLWLECQRCLKAVETPLQIDRHFLFVHGEEQAAEVDAESEDDVLALTRSLDLLALIEDELLLALPLVPRHEICAVPLQAGGSGESPEDAPNPFATLAHLKRTGPPN